MIFPISNEVIFKYIETICNINNEIPSGPSYILPDGRFIHIESLQIPFIKIKPMHPTLEIFIKQKFNIPEDELFNLIVKLGCIRINDGTVYFNDVYIDLPDKITEDQYDSLIKYLDKNINSKNLKQMSIGHTKDLVYNSLQEDYLDTDDIIRKIKLYMSQNI